MQITTPKNIRGYFNDNGYLYLYLKDIVYGLEFTKIRLSIFGEHVTMDKERVLSYLNSFGKYYEKITDEYISEEVFYKLADLADKNDRTEEFKKKIKNEIIPKIRRKWAFSIKNKDNDEIILAKALLISKNIIKKLENKTKKLENDKDNEVLNFDSKKEYNDFLRVNKQIFSMKQIADEFSLEEEKLKSFLKEEGLIHNFGSEWILSIKFLKEKLIIRKIIRIKNMEDKQEIFWTINGKEKIRKILKKYIKSN